MEDSRDTGKAPSEQGKRAFLAQIEQRIAAIEENWGELRSGPWERDLLDSLYDRIRDLAEGANRYDLFQLGESIFSAEVYLSSFVDVAAQPSPHQIEEIDGLIRTLRAAVEDTTQSDPSDSGETSGDRNVYVLSEGTDLIGPVVQALEERGCRISNFDEAAALVRAMDEQLPAAILVDTAQLVQISPVSAERVRLHAQQAIHVPIVFVSGSKNLQLRVDALRAGADAYFVAPVDAGKVADRLLQLAEPEEPEPPRVMVVEDDPAQADFAASILRKAGMEVRTITEPLKAIDALEDFGPDLILMDIYMPDINGMELTTIIREQNEFVAAPIVFISGEQSTDKQLDALSVGGDDFIAKPIKPKHLLAIVKHRIERARNVQRAVGLRRERDRVTGLFSRRHFFDRLAKALELPSARATPMGVIHLRPDRLKGLSQSHGVGAVDAMIAELGERVRHHIEANDVASRFDEHSIAVLARRDAPAAIDALAEELRAAIAAQPFDMGGNPETVTVSVGVCHLEEHLDDPSGLAARAERASDEAHSSGGNRVAVYQSEAAAAPDEAAQSTGQAIRQALEQENLLLHYQPLLDLQARGSESYELLLRVPTPSGDLLTEDEIHDPGAEAGVLPELDKWLVERALEMLKDRREAAHPTRLFIRQFGPTAYDPDFPAWLAGRLRHRQTVGTGLVLDYRLADVSHNLKAAQANFRALREMDIEVCLSRFPEKPAAFKVLRFLEANYIEVAPRLLKADRETIKYVVDQAHEIQAKVIVGNIDDPRSVDLHWSSGADYLQGNFIQRPLEHMDYDFYQVVV